MDWHEFKLRARLDGGRWHHISPGPGVVIGLQWVGDPCGWLLSVECRAILDPDIEAQMALNTMFGEWFVVDWRYEESDGQTSFVSGVIRELIPDAREHRPNDVWLAEVIEALEGRGSEVRA